jgi:hypothetical protein
MNQKKKKKKNETLSILWEKLVLSESRYALIKGVESDVHERLYSKNTSPVLHFNRCLTTECSERRAHFNGNLDTDNQTCIP